MEAIRLLNVDHNPIFHEIQFPAEKKEDGSNFICHCWHFTTLNFIKSIWQATNKYQAVKKIRFFRLPMSHGKSKNRSEQLEIELFLIASIQTYRSVSFSSSPFSFLFSILKLCQIELQIIQQKKNVEEVETEYCKIKYSLSGNRKRASGDVHVHKEEP